MPPMREQPPMPLVATMNLTVRDNGREEIPVARITFHDVQGDTREMDFHETTAFALAMDLLRFCQQLRMHP